MRMREDWKCEHGIPHPKRCYACEASADESDAVSVPWTDASLEARYRQHSRTTKTQRSNVRFAKMSARARAFAEAEAKRRRIERRREQRLAEVLPMYERLYAAPAPEWVPRLTHYVRATGDDAPIEPLHGANETVTRSMKDIEYAVRANSGEREITWGRRVVRIGRRPYDWEDAD